MRLIERLSGIRISTPDSVCVSPTSGSQAAEQWPVLTFPARLPAGPLHGRGPSSSKRTETGRRHDNELVCGASTSPHPPVQHSISPRLSVSAGEAETAGGADLGTSRRAAAERARARAAAGGAAGTIPCKTFIACVESLRQHHDQHPCLAHSALAEVPVHRACYLIAGPTLALTHAMVAAGTQSAPAERDKAAGIILRHGQC